MAVPEIDAHEPELFKKETLTCESDSRSEVLPEWVFVWKMRSMPPVSFMEISRSAGDLIMQHSQRKDRVSTYLRSQCHAAGNQQTGVGNAGSQHAKLAGPDEVAEIIDLLLHTRLILVLGLVSTRRSVDVHPLLCFCAVVEEQLSAGDG